MQASNSGGFFRPQILNRILLVLGFIGIFDASLLSAEVLWGLNLNCGAEGGCATVASHPSAFWFHIPVAYFGFFAYLTLTILASVRAIKGVEENRPLVYAGYAMAGVGALVSIYLQYMALVVIGAFCPYCFGSAVNMILTLVLYAVLAQKLAASSAVQASGEAVESASGYYGAPSDATWVGLGSLATVVAVILGSAILVTTHKPPTIITKDRDLGRLLPTAGDAHTVGNIHAPVRITEFADLACIHCQMLTPKLHAFVAEHPATVYAVYRHFPLIKQHQMALTAALVSEYAARKGKFWDYANRIFATNAEPTTWDEVAGPAQEIGLNLADVKNEISKDDNPEMKAVQKDINDANYFGLNTTPTFFIEAPGVRVHVATSNDIFEILTSSPFKEIIAGKRSAAK